MKCSYCAKKNNYLRYIIRTGRLELSKETTAAVRELKHPTAQTELRSFLGVWKVFRRFGPNFSRVGVLLNKKLRKDQSTSFVSLTRAEKDAIESLKTLLMNPPILALLRAIGPHTVRTDVCDSQINVYFYDNRKTAPQDQLDCCWSHSLSSAKKKLATTQKQYLAVV